MQEKADKAELIDFKPGETIFRERDPSGCMYILREGQVEVYITTPDGRIPLAIVNSGEFLGELSCIVGGARTATAIALTKVKVVRVQKEFMDETLQKAPVWMNGLIRCPAGRIQDMNELLRRNKVVDQQLKTKLAAAESRIDQNKFAS